MSEGTIAEVTLGGKTFNVWFFAEPDTSLLDQPINGPEHNCKLAQLLKLLKSKTPDSAVLADGDYIDDRQYARRLWLEELKTIENRLAGQLREQLEGDAGGYLTHGISASGVFDKSGVAEKI